MPEPAPQDVQGLSLALAGLRRRLARLIDAADMSTPSETDDAPGMPCGALAVLGDRFGLSAFEREIVLLCAAAELDPSIPAACALAQKEPQRAYPTGLSHLEICELSEHGGEELVVPAGTLELAAHGAL
ncbi:hypothetical protein FHP25_37600 [Vineibacter terrae]|uniref:Winged helix domain-containing protein n=1 Tax=Vineibacter terrae TaxID=2586908 RepID=A0A5C8P7U7_9HYPH|nr:hypothetical protein [Vineibacter terrae]TXL69796.1 hypothetical protein FHP25_37600 [Vineibacter terrae]